MQTILQLGMMLIAMFAIFVVLQLTIQNKYVILDIIFLGFIITTYEWISGTTIRISMLMFRLGLTDILCIYLLLCVAIFRKKNRLIRDVRWIWYIVVVIFVFGIIRGLSQNAFNSVLEDVRRLVWAFVVPVACMGALPFSFDDPKTVRRMNRYCNIVVVFCFVCWGLDLILGVHLVSAQSDAETTMRVLRPEQTLVMAMFAVKSVYDDLNSQDKKISKKSILLILVVILLQHRSAWVSLAVGLGYLFIIASIDSGRTKRLLKSKKFVFQMFGIIVVSAATLFALRNTTLIQQLLIGLQGLRGDEGTTLNYRQQLWTAHFATLDSVEWVIGKPFGHGYYINLAGYGRDLTPHSAYVQTIIRCGLLGVSSVVIYLLSVLRSARKVHFGTGEAFCVMLLTFFYAYTYNFFTAIILGVTVRTLCGRYWRNGVNE